MKETKRVNKKVLLRIVWYRKAAIITYTEVHYGCCKWYCFTVSYPLFAFFAFPIHNFPMTSPYWKMCLFLHYVTTKGIYNASLAEYSFILYTSAYFVMNFLWYMYVQLGAAQLCTVHVPYKLKNMKIKS
jgi:hypothetical protein